MPGVLKDSQDEPRLLKPIKRRLVDDMAEQPAKKVKREGLPNGIQAVNGDHGLPNGINTNGMIPVQKESLDASVAGLEGLIGGELPPELEHVTTNWASVSSLITRLTQETFNQLVDTVNDLSEIEVTANEGPSPYDHSYTPMNSSKSAVSASQANVEKKQKMLNFAQDRRTQFIKVLVLSQWCRRAGEMEKVVDIGYWLKLTGKAPVAGCVGWMREMTKQLNPTKVPNPDLKTALEALSLGKASWLTDLNYLPPEKIPPQDLLKTLRKINTLLSIRLNMHETIPAQFRDFAIASGRATFRVKNEFEVDLAIADEDPKSQLYFLDLRFLFSPVKPELPLGRLRDDLENKLNDILKADGLTGCYKFLHDFVLTHKLSILRNQAYEMIRSHWSDQIKVEAVHRSLVVQYWLQRPGSKNWIEIGIKRGKTKSPNASDAGQGNPEIALRWFRAGKEIKDIGVELGLDNLSLAGILRRIIALHSTHIFKETAAQLREGSLYSERLLKLKQSFSATEPTNISLLVQLTKSNAIKVMQEPITGQFAIFPVTQLNTGAERELNSLPSPAVEASARLATLRCIAAREEFNVCAHSASWEAVHSLNVDRETMQRFFPRNTLRIAFFRRKLWKPNWLLAMTTSIMGDSVWVVETSGRMLATELTSNSICTGPTIKSAFNVSDTVSRALIVEPSFVNLRKIERTVVGMIAQHLDTLQLSQQGVPYRLQSHSSASGASSTSIYMKYTTENSTQNVKNPSPMALNWRNNIILLRFAGLDSATSSGNHLVRARMKKAIPNIKALTSELSSSITFRPSTAEFAFRITTPVGVSTIPNLLHRLATIEHLLGFLTIIKRRKLPCTVHSLTCLSFDYATSPTMKATIDFPSDEPMRITFDPSSPHLRIQDAFTEMLRSPAGGLVEVLAHIDTTLPLLRAITNIEASWVNPRDRVDILPRSAECFIIRYHDPNGRVEISLHDRRGDVMWLIKERGVPKGESRDEGLDKGLKELAQGSGEYWKGLNGCMVATPKGVEILLGKLDEIFKAGRREESAAGDDLKGSITQGLTNGNTPKIEEHKPVPTNPRKRKAESAEEDVVVLD